MTKVWIPPHDPCIRCGAVVEVVDNQLVCSGCGQLWKIGPEGCWEAEFEKKKKKNRRRVE